jgi:hypothetical protein
MIRHTIYGRLWGHYECCKCGEKVFVQDYDEEPAYIAEMAEMQLCYECHYWQTLPERCPADYIILNGKLIWAPRYVLPFTKPRHFIKTNKDIFRTCYMPVVDEVPERFRDHVRDNVVEISREQYYDISTSYRKKCDRKGCWDRRDCLWYEGPMDWNKIPANHKMGDEECQSFIVKTIFDNL